MKQSMDVNMHPYLRSNSIWKLSDSLGIEIIDDNEESKLPVE